jgi:hypothetical protein
MRVGIDAHKMKCTFYSTPSGVTAYKTSSYNSTEANSKLRMMEAFTVNNFATFITGGGGGTLIYRNLQVPNILPVLDQLEDPMHRPI